MAGAQVIEPANPSGTPTRFDVMLVDLDPTLGSEIQKRRPCLIVSPDEMHRTSSLVIIAPMTSHGRPFPTHVRCRFKGKNGQILVEQIRTVDRMRFVRRLGRLDTKTAATVLTVLADMFAP